MTGVVGVCSHLTDDEVVDVEELRQLLHGQVVLDAAVAVLVVLRVVVAIAGRPCASIISTLVQVV